MKHPQVVTEKFFNKNDTRSQSIFRRLAYRISTTGIYSFICACIIIQITWMDPLFTARVSKKTILKKDSGLLLAVIQMADGLARENALGLFLFCDKLLD
jgi:hypothetical protein